MPIWGKIAGTILSSFGIGNGSPGDKTIYAETGAVNPPAIRWNSTDSVWDISFDGTTWEEIVTKPRHKTLRQLIHFVETNSPGDGFGAGPYVSEITYTGIFPLTETWYENAGKTKKICSWEVTYNPNKTWATEKWIVFKDDGVNPSAEAADVISYSGLAETGRARTITVY